MTSCVLRDAVTPAQMEHVAFALLKREDGAGVTYDDLRKLHFHPAVQAMVDNGHLASACLASLHHTRQFRMEVGRVGLTSSTLPNNWDLRMCLDCPRQASDVLSSAGGMLMAFMCPVWLSVFVMAAWLYRSRFRTALLLSVLPSRSWGVSPIAPGSVWSPDQKSCCYQIGLIDCITTT